jgi:predicted nucleic acid-binding protein
VADDREKEAAKTEKKGESSLTFTFDTGMLIALERRKQRAVRAFQAITHRGFVPFVPAVVCVEWWRGRTDIREAILSAVIVEDMPPLLCQAAGEALAVAPGASLADAVVMASAALRGGGIVYTSDAGDLARFARRFPTVRIIDA